MMHAAPKILLLIAIMGCGAACKTEPPIMRVYVGTYTGPKSQGIYVLNMDMRTGELSTPELAARTSRPSFVAPNSSGTCLYCVDEESDMQGKKTGAVRAFSLDRSTGKLTELNYQFSDGMGPCYVGIDHDDRNVLVANYASGSVSVIPISSDGKLAKPSAFDQHHGSSVDPKRQEGPHAHLFNVDPTNRYALSMDLGLDQVLVYRFDSAKGTIQPNDPPFATVAPGRGPRHLAWAADGRFAYVSTEMGNTVEVFAYDSSQGRLTHIQSISTVPPDNKEVSYAAEVAMHPGGGFVYASNRGQNTIAAFRVDRESGRLTSVGHVPCGGNWPRHFAIDPTGVFLIVANEKSDHLAVFRIDEESGMPISNGVTVEIGSPTCVRFVSAR